MIDNFSEQGIIGCLFKSQVLVAEGLLTLFTKLSQMGATCSDDSAGINLVDYFESKPQEDFYFITFGCHSFLMYYIAEPHNALCLTSNLDCVQQDENDNLIQTMNQLIDELFLSLAFTSAYIDLEGDPPPRYFEDIEKVQVHWLFWTNYFGKAYIEKYGKDFLLQAPGSSSTKICDSAIKYLIRSDPRLELPANLVSEIRAYFSPKTTVEIYNWEQFGFI